MAEVSIAAFRVASGVAIALTIVCFILRSKGHLDGSHIHDYDNITTDDAHVHKE